MWAGRREEAGNLNQYAGIGSERVRCKPYVTNLCDLNLDHYDFNLDHDLNLDHYDLNLDHYDLNPFDSFDFDFGGQRARA
jgi:hypothetical protein